MELHQLVFLLDLVYHVMKPFTTEVMLHHCQWCDFTRVIMPLDGSVGVKYGCKNA